MTITNKDVIDLTAGVSDLGTSKPDTSLAKKRSRRESNSNSDSQRDQKKVKKVGLVGKPFHTREKEKHHRAIQYEDLLIEVSCDLSRS
jgi:hypothetical protein